MNVDLRNDKHLRKVCYTSEKINNFVVFDVCYIPFSNEKSKE